MQKERKLIIAGNWKMNKTAAEAVDLVKNLKLELASVKESDIVVFVAGFMTCMLGLLAEVIVAHHRR